MVSVVVFNIATPLVTVLLPSCVSPSKKTTVPVGAMVREGMDAVRVTALEINVGFGVGVTEIAGVSGYTVRVTVAVACA